MLFLFLFEKCGTGFLITLLYLFSCLSSQCLRLVSNNEVNAVGYSSQCVDLFLLWAIFDQYVWSTYPFGKWTNLDAHRTVPRFKIPPAVVQLLSFPVQRNINLILFLLSLTQSRCLVIRPKNPYLIYLPSCIKADLAGFIIPN